MLRETEAVRFDRPVGSGRTKPIWVGVEEAEDGDVIDVLAKYTGHELTVEGLVRETMAALLAADLMLGTPEPLLVRIGSEFILSVSSATSGGNIAASLRNSLVLAYGSKKLPNGFNIWSADRPIPDGLMQQALEIFCFDCLIQNPDRSSRSPNVLCNGSSFAIIDHELAFITNGIIGWNPPWIVDALSSFAINHIFFGKLRCKTDGLDIDRIFDKFASIKDSRIDAYINALPSEWGGGLLEAQNVASYIKQIKINVLGVKNEVMRVLQ